MLRKVFKLQAATKLLPFANGRDELGDDIFSLAQKAILRNHEECGLALGH
jgi:hypothetical protein